jgi:hypothetical protein
MTFLLTPLEKNRVSHAFLDCGPLRFASVRNPESSGVKAKP